MEPEATPRPGGVERHYFWAPRALLIFGQSSMTFCKTKQKKVRKWNVNRSVWSHGDFLCSYLELLRGWLAHLATELGRQYQPLTQVPLTITLSGIATEYCLNSIFIMRSRLTKFDG